jgi:hypothetical protein
VTWVQVRERVVKWINHIWRIYTCVTLKACHETSFGRPRSFIKFILILKIIDISGGLNRLGIAVVGVVVLNLEGLVPGIGVLIRALLEYTHCVETVISNM